MELISFDKQGTGYSQDSKILKFSDSAANEYIPFIAGFDGSPVTKGNKRVLMYNEYEPRARHYTGKLSLLECFRTYMIMAYYQPRRLRSSPNYNSMFLIKKGILYYTEDGSYTNVYPLMILGVHGKYVFQLNRNNIDYQKFALFMKDDFHTNPFYKPVYNIFKPYILECQAAGMSMVHTKNIRSWLYKTSFEYPRFETPAQMKEYLKNLNNLMYES